MKSKAFLFGAFGIRVVQSGSKGNCYIINNIMLDLGKGVAWKSVSPFISYIKHIFISHKHSDHYDPKKLDKILKEYPKITIYLNTDNYFTYVEETQLDLEQYKNRIIIYDNKKIYAIPFRGGKIHLRAFKVPHLNPDGSQCINYGCLIRYTDQDKENNLMYITDTHTLDGVVVPNNIDVLLLEANYEYERAKRIDQEKQEAGQYSPFNRVKLSHFEIYKSYSFAANHLADNGYMIEIHQSSSNRLPNEKMRITKDEIIYKLKKKGLK